MRVPVAVLGGLSRSPRSGREATHREKCATRTGAAVPQRVAQRAAAPARTPRTPRAPGRRGRARSTSGARSPRPSSTAPSAAPANASWASTTAPGRGALQRLADPLVLGHVAPVPGRRPPHHRDQAGPAAPRARCAGSGRRTADGTTAPASRSAPRARAPRPPSGRGPPRTAKSGSGRWSTPCRPTSWPSRQDAGDQARDGAAPGSAARRRSRSPRARRGRPGRRGSRRGRGRRRRSARSPAPWCGPRPPSRPAHAARRRARLRPAGSRLRGAIGARAGVGARRTRRGAGPRPRAASRRRASSRAAPRAWSTGRRRTVPAAARTAPRTTRPAPPSTARTRNVARAGGEPREPQPHPYRGVAVAHGPRQHPAPGRAGGRHPVDRHGLGAPDHRPAPGVQLAGEEGVLAPGQPEAHVEALAEPAQLRGRRRAGCRRRRR